MSGSLSDPLVSAFRIAGTTGMSGIEVVTFKDTEMLIMTLIKLLLTVYMN